MQAVPTRNATILIGQQTPHVVNIFGWVPKPDRNHWIVNRVIFVMAQIQAINIYTFSPTTEARFINLETLAGACVSEPQLINNYI